MGHIGGKTHHRHNEETQAGETRREHVADELDNVQVVVSSRKRFFGHECARIKENRESKHGNAACNENKGRVLPFYDRPSDEDEYDATEDNSGHESLLRSDCSQDPGRVFPGIYARCTLPMHSILLSRLHPA